MPVLLVFWWDRKKYFCIGNFQLKLTQATTITHTHHIKKRKEKYKCVRLQNPLKLQRYDYTLLLRASTYINLSSFPLYSNLLIVYAYNNVNLFYAISILCAYENASFDCTLRKGILSATLSLSLSLIKEDNNVQLAILFLFLYSLFWCKISMSQNIYIYWREISLSRDALFGFVHKYHYYYNA